MVALARDLLAGLPRAAADSFTVIFGDAAAAEAAGGSGGLSNPVASADPSAGKQLVGPLLIVGATQQQVLGGGLPQRAHRGAVADCIETYVSRQCGRQMCVSLVCDCKSQLTDSAAAGGTPMSVRQLVQSDQQSCQLQIYE